MPETYTPTDWGNVRPQKRSPGESTREDRNSARFFIGLTTFLAVAAIYPWYSYRAQAHLLASDVKELVAGTDAAAKAALAEQQAQLSGMRQRQRESDRRSRLASIRVLGVSERDGVPVAIVDLGTSSLSEATPRICAQARQLRAGASFEDRWIVQRTRGRSPAATIGTIRCD
jgi:hypothetical protein